MDDDLITPNAPIFTQDLNSMTSMPLFFMKLPRPRSRGDWNCGLSLLSAGAR